MGCAMPLALGLRRPSDQPVGPGGVAERYVPRFFALVGIIRILWPALARRLLKGGMGKRLVTRTGADAADQAAAQAGSEGRPPTGPTD